MKFLKAKLLFTAAAVILLFGCSQNKLSDYDKIQEKLVSMESYTCNAEIKYISNKTENVYKTKQYVKNDGRYRIETTKPEDLSGTVVLFDGKMIWQYNPKIESRISVNIPDKPERQQILIFTFMRNFVKSQGVSVESAVLDESLYTVLEAVIPGNNKFFSTEKLWVSNSTKLPEQLIIYDTDGNERVIASFSSFEYNTNIDDTLFKLTQEHSAAN